jgi:hypothetical protein
MNVKPPGDLEVFIEGIGLLGPGLQGWPAAAPLLVNPGRYAPAPLTIPTPDCLPPAERRRVGAQVKLALAVGREAVAQSQRDAASLANVFSASSGDGENCHAICEALAGPDRLISPTRFHNSVHNAAAGYWGIAMKCMAPSTSLCAHDGSFAAGLLEAAVQARAGQGATLLVSSDAPYPEPLNSVRPMRAAFAIGLVMAARHSDRALARLRLSLTHAIPGTLAQSELESLRLDSPAARALPLLLSLAGPPAQPAAVHLPFVDGCTLSVALELIRSPAW